MSSAQLTYRPISANSFLNFIFILYLASIITLSNYDAFNLAFYALNLILILCIFLFINIKNNGEWWKIKLNSFVIAHGIFAFLALMSTFWSINSEASLSKGFSLLLLFINSVFVYNALTSKSFNNHIFFYGILLGAWINIILWIISLISNVGLNSILYFDNRFIGTTTNANEIGLIFSLTIFCCLYLMTEKKKKLFYLITIAFSIILVIITGSKKSLLFSFLLITLFPFISMKLNLKLILISILIIFSVSLFLINIEDIIVFIDIDYFTNTYSRFNRFLLELSDPTVGGSTSDRIHLIKEAIDIFKDNPFVGSGINTFSSIEGLYTHNNYLEILTGLGLVGLIIYYYLYYYSLKSVSFIQDKNKRRLCYLLLFLLLLVDLTAVTYYNKIHLMFLLLFSTQRF